MPSTPPSPLPPFNPARAFRTLSTTPSVSVPCPPPTLVLSFTVPIVPLLSVIRPPDQCRPRTPYNICPLHSPCRQLTPLPPSTSYNPTFSGGGNFRFAGTQAFLNSGEKNPCKVQVWGSQAVRCYTRVFKLLCTTCPWLNCGTNWVERVGMARLSMTPWAIMRETGVARDVNNPGQRATKTNQNWLGAVPAKDGFAGTAQNWKSQIFLCWGAMTYFGLVEIAPPKWPCC